MRLRTILAVAVSLASSSGSFAATLAYSGTSGNNTGATNPINIGREFSVTGGGITVVDLGIFAEDATGNAITLSNSHAVTLFSIETTNAANPTNTPLATVTVPAGATAPYDSGFRFAAITPIHLAAGNYAVIGYGLDQGNESYADGGGRLTSTNANDLGFDPYQFTSAGSPSFPDNGDGNNHSGASFHFDDGDTTPEPTSLAFVGVAASTLVVRRRRSN